MNYSKYVVIFIINLLVSVLALYKITYFALKWVDIYTKHDSSVIVPDLRHLTLSQSISILKKLGLKYNIDTSHYDPNFKPYQIISFTPGPGDKVKEGRHIYLQVNSKYTQYTVLPNIINKNKNQAIKLLHANHIAVKEIKYINDLYNKDSVLKVFYKDKLIQSGYIFPPYQDGITLIIGKGYEKNNSLVPNVIGMSLNTATSTLNSRLFYVINFYYDHTISNNNAKVYCQKPSPGTMQEDKNKPIELWLSSKELLDSLIQIEEKTEKEKILSKKNENEKHK
ncbi:PASTA domain-containing protein [Blattabacterium cuenoti]|uniref:PASTA domain-containing protein n=1 Tax=Blattabacterium cuenoti TaxID=1653831 RepID=UPI00163C8D67|nr:PASTA domain-containing protein [Blattabacterium cuenoti]